MSFLLELLRKIPLSKAGPAAGFLAGLLALFVIGYRMRWWQSLRHALGPWFWMGFVLLVVVGTFVAILWFLPRYREKRFLERLHSEDEQTPQADVKEGYRRLEEKMRQTLDKLRKAPALKNKGNPLYALPWYLLLGASQSGKTTLLQGVAKEFLPFARPQSTAEEGPPQDCEWWFFSTAIVLDTPGSYAFPKEVKREGEQWYRFLGLLRHYRELQPINGLVITVAADSLASKPADQIRQEAEELRKRVDEVIRELGVDVPVYLLITRCDLIDGFTEFCSYLSEHTWKKVFGYVYEWPQAANGQQPNSTESLKFETVFTSFLAERLQQIRLSMLNAESPLPAELRQQLFCFPEEFRALQQPLGTFIDTFLYPFPTLHMPHLRGLFFSSAQQQGIPTSFLRRTLHFDGQSRALTQETRTYFLHDLFKEILPRDQYLARPTPKAKGFRLFKHLFVLVSSLVLCLLLFVGLTKASRDDRQAVRTANPARCAAAAEKVGGEPLLEAAEDCRQEVQALTDRNRRRPIWGKLIFSRSVKLEKKLRHDYVKKFSTEVLLPLDVSLTRHLDTNAETIPLVFLLIKRIQWLDQCLSGGGCLDSPPSREPPDYQLAPDNYRLMLAPARQHSPAPERVGQLQRTYEAYLRWSLGVSRVLNQEREAHAERLQRWFSKNRFAPQQILQWANQSYPPVTLAEYWQGHPSGEGNNITLLPGAYTRKAWQQSIAPFLQRALETVPAMGPQVATFRKEYRQQYLDRWQRFLENFPREEAFWKRTPEQRRKLAIMLLSEKSPYSRIIDGAFENLQPVLPAAPKVTTPRAAMTPEPVVSDAKAAMPPWLRLLQQYIGSKDRKAFLGILKQLGKQLTAENMGEQCFRLASAGFQESKAPAESPHPLLQAWGIVGHFREQAGAGVDAKPFWPLLERPVQFVWEMVLYEAGKDLQERWTQKVIKPLKGLSELDQLKFLYGSQRKVRAFVDDVAKPFLTEDGKHVKKVLGMEAPLSPGFFKALEVAEQIEPILSMLSEGSQTVVVEAGGKSLIDSQANLSEEKTEFQLECKSKTYKVLDQSQQLPETSATIFWSPDACGDVSLTIFLRPPAASMTTPEASALPLRKRYIGLAGFLRFIHDFSDGKHEFRATDFGDPSHAGANWKTYGIKAIRVFYRVGVPPTLGKLIALMPNSDQIVTPTVIKGEGTI